MLFFHVLLLKCKYTAVVENCFSSLHLLPSLFSWKVAAPVYGDSFFGPRDGHSASPPHQLPFLSHVCDPWQLFLMLHTKKFKHRINVSKDFIVDASQLWQVFQQFHCSAVLQQRYTNRGNKFAVVQDNDKDTKYLSIQSCNHRINFFEVTLVTKVTAIMHLFLKTMLESRIIHLCD